MVRHSQAVGQSSVVSHIPRSYTLSMSDTARDYRTIETAATIEGLEDFFADTGKPSGPASGPSRDEDAVPSQLVSAL